MYSKVKNTLFIILIIYSVFSVVGISYFYFCELDVIILTAKFDAERTLEKELRTKKDAELYIKKELTPELRKEIENQLLEQLIGNHRIRADYETLENGLIPPPSL